MRIIKIDLHKHDLVKVKANLADLFIEDDYFTVTTDFDNLDNPQTMFVVAKNDATATYLILTSVGSSCSQIDEYLDEVLQGA